VLIARRHGPLRGWPQQDSLPQGGWVRPAATRVSRLRSDSGLPAEFSLRPTRAISTRRLWYGPCVVLIAPGKHQEAGKGDPNGMVLTVPPGRM